MLTKTAQDRYNVNIKRNQSRSVTIVVPESTRKERADKNE